MAYRRWEIKDDILFGAFVILCLPFLVLVPFLLPLWLIGHFSAKYIFKIK